MLSVLPIGDEDGEMPNQIPRAVLTRIIRARVEETLEIIRDRLNQSGYGQAIGKRIVLTGGGSQLQGLAEVARRILARNVRIGRPLGVAGLPEAARGPAFATTAGLLIYPQVAEFEISAARYSARQKMTGTSGRIARMGNWLKESL
jgi:cell division protein FtsA